MGTIILELAALAFVAYWLYRFRRWTEDYRFNRQKSKISQDKVKDQWSEIIDKAKGRGDELLERVARLVKDDNIPHIQLAKRPLSVDGAAWHPFLVVSNDKLKGYEMLVGAFDYGERLSVVWYLIFDSPEHLALREAALRGRITDEREQAGFAAKAIREGYVAPENLSMLDKQELANYTSLVHKILKGEVKKIMDDLDLDFSKVDTHTRGLLNLS